MTLNVKLLLNNKVIYYFLTTGVDDIFQLCTFLNIGSEVTLANVNLNFFFLMCYDKIFFLKFILIFDLKRIGN